MIRHAVIEGKGHDDLETVRRYLPSNYEADSDGGSIFIHGEDYAGWTLDGYVIPRLASGLWFAKEIPDPEDLMAPCPNHIETPGVNCPTCGY